MKRLGIDAGSTTLKCAVLDEDGRLVFSVYDRHMARIGETLSALLLKVAERFPGERFLTAATGSAGLGVCRSMGLPFVQEVYATRLAVKRFLPDTDTVIELGGEDAKILFMKDTEVRMNGSCAGGTGAFIDQMTELLGLDARGMEAAAERCEKRYTIASRCGVFAKSDIQPLLNQGVRKEDVAGSIFYAVVNQTVAGLAQGREISGRVLYLGGPLTFFPYLRKAFDDTLRLEGVCPDNSLYYAAMGSALSPEAGEADPAALASVKPAKGGFLGCAPLFENREQYEEFVKRHQEDSRGIKILEEPSGTMYLGIDAGSTTVKALLTDADGNIFFPMYTQGSGDPVGRIRKYLEDLYGRWPNIRIGGSAVTGYGEAIIQNAFSADLGVVETIAHFTAASRFCPQVDFIIDIGGQDIKCVHIRNGAIDSIFLNEACSSGCGSFLQAFAGVLGFGPAEFARKALFADRPVDLGSRCTVFMNGSVKQAQKDGASLENISAGLAVSVVKNALYKVIRCADPARLGKNIVVQGGTFLNDAVLRAFEQEIGKPVLRPSVSGLMGAYGAALYAMEHKPEATTLCGPEELRNFEHKARAVTCQGCSNHCGLTVNTFSNGKKFIAGNRCEKPLRLPASRNPLDLYKYKQALLKEYEGSPAEGRTNVALPMGLNMYELLPFWSVLFRELGFNVYCSGPSDYSLYLKGQHTIPSDTVCYPAKLMHGHMERLIGLKPDIIFYPGMSYNVDEKRGRNHYNCPVVAYYPKLIEANVAIPEGVKYISGFIGLHDRRAFPAKFAALMK
ncbi:MAG: 2-hydroxyglutaryl-CoA dehydratase, partial [Abditibacteriota bacterium]|nr:2-hydroxyglutaryl-CoA dehydratase [Abditibacteriota bacterium]